MSTRDLSSSSRSRNASPANVSSGIRQPTSSSSYNSSQPSRSTASSLASRQRTSPPTATRSSSSSPALGPPPRGAQSSHPSRKYYGSSSYGEEDEDDAMGGRDDEYDELVNQLQDVKSNSVQSSRNALRHLREAEESGASTLTELNNQTERLKKVDQQLTVADLESTKGQNKATELKKLNRNFLVAKLGFGNPFSSSKKKEKKLQAKVDAMRASQNSAEDGTAVAAEDHNGRSSSGSRNGTGSSGGSAGYTSGGVPSRSNRLEHEANCEMEDEIDSNLDEIGSSLARIKNMAIQMGNNIDESTDLITRQSDKVTSVTNRVDNTARKLNKIN